MNANAIFGSLALVVIGALWAWIAADAVADWIERLLTAWLERPRDR